MVTSYMFSIADPAMYLHTAPTISAATSATASPATRETDTTAKVSSRNTSNWPNSSLYWGSGSNISHKIYNSCTPNLDVKTVGVKNSIWTVKPTVRTGNLYDG